MRWNDEILRELKKFGKFLEVTVCIYAIFKNASKFSQNLFLPNVFISSILITLASMITMGLYLFVLLPLTCYKVLMMTILRVKHKRNYGGLLQGPDVMWLFEKDTCRNVVNYLLIIEFDKNGNLIDFAKDVCRKRFFKSERLTSLRLSFMGYAFLLKNQLTPDDVVKDMFLPQGSCDTDTLKKFLQHHNNKPLPKNNTSTWELVVGQQSVKLKGFENEENLFPLLLRVHHSIADGITLLSFLINHVADENVPDLQTPTVKTRARAGIKNVLGLNSHLIAIFHGGDENDWRNEVLSGEKRLGLHIERESKYTEIVKRIKKIFVGATFTDVILTAISASLDAHFEKKSQTSPSEITLSFMVATNRTDLIYVDKKLGNIFSVGSIKLPINLGKTNGDPLLERFTKTREAYERYNRSHDIWINYWLLHDFIDLLPSLILRHVLKAADISTIGFSNLPGFKQIRVCGRSLKHLLFWVPNYQKLGVGFSLVTYDDRFHMGLVVDKAVVSEEEEVQEILDDVFNYIQRMNGEFFGSEHSYV